MSYEDVSKAWAGQQLRERNIPYHTIKSVYFEIRHNGCYGHFGDEYCYCDTSSVVDVSIHYGTTASFSNRDHCTFEWHDLESLLKELVEWEVGSEVMEQ